MFHSLWGPWTADNRGYVTCVQLIFHRSTNCSNVRLLAGHIDMHTFNDLGGEKGPEKLWTFPGLYLSVLSCSGYLSRPKSLRVIHLSTYQPTLCNDCSRNVRSRLWHRLYVEGCDVKRCWLMENLWFWRDRFRICEFGYVQLIIAFVISSCST